MTSPTVPPTVTTTTTLYAHEPHAHPLPRDPHAPSSEDERPRGVRGHVNAFNLWLAKYITLIVGTMWCAYAFMFLALTGMPPAGATLHEWVQWFSQTFLQLVFLPVLAVGGAVLNRHAERQADEQFHATMRTLHGEQQVTHHLNAQDAELLKQTSLIIQLLSRTTPTSGGTV